MTLGGRITQQQLESYLWGAATLLRGTIDAGDYKQFIFPLLFYKRLCDVFDEETRDALCLSGGNADFAAYPENHRFQVPAEAHWREVRRVAREVGQALQAGMRAIETANPDKLYGIFGDAQWTNKDRLPDAMLRDLVEHFSSLDLSVANLPEDELGQGYEYLIKQFADDSGHTAAEFYTNRTVVHLMTEMLEPKSGESIYDPTCGSGGMLLSAIAHLRRQGQEWRNVRLYGQERNLMTSSIARMNCFLHGVEDFQIVRGDTLAEPKLVEGDRLMRFDVVLANPPYSIKQWDRAAFAQDPWGRNVYGTPPQGRADYAFWQHILASLAPERGRCAILFPHGVLFRQEEAEMRRKLVEADLIECVLGLGPNLFYNSPMEACVVVCRARKPRGRRGKILFVNAVSEVTRERAQSFLTEAHVERIASVYRAFEDVSGFAKVVTREEIRARDGNLSIPLYVEPARSNGAVEAKEANPLAESLTAWLRSASEAREALGGLLGEEEPNPLALFPSPRSGQAPSGKGNEMPLQRWGGASRRAGERSGERSVPGSESSATSFVGPSTAVTLSLSLSSLLNRDGWSRLPFGAFADSVNERVEPADAADEVYVGLEHLDPGSLHLRRWGKGSDVIGTKLRFREGDVIFARRRAYQRKLAVAEMDGICSAHAMVVRAKPALILAEFLPFLMMSDRFMKRAVEISVGSLSPTINWTTLKQEQFDLPPLDQQRRIAEVLWAVDETMEGFRSLREAAAQHLHSQITDAMRTHVLTTDDRSGARQLGDLFSERRENGYTSLRVLAVTIAGRVVPRESLERSVIDRTGTEKYLRVCPGDIAYNTMRMWQGSCGVVSEEGIISSAYTVLVPRPDVADSIFWNYAFHTLELLDWFRRFSTGVAKDRWRLYYRSLAKIPVHVPVLSMQRQFVEQFGCSERVVAHTQARVALLWSVLSAAVDAFCDDAVGANR